MSVKPDESGKKRVFSWNVLCETPRRKRVSGGGKKIWRNVVTGSTIFHIACGDPLIIKHRECSFKDLKTLQILVTLNKPLVSLTSVRYKSSNCFWALWRSSSSSRDSLNDRFCSDVRFLANLSACSTNFSSEAADKYVIVIFCPSKSKSQRVTVSLTVAVDYDSSVVVVDVRHRLHGLLSHVFVSLCCVTHLPQLSFHLVLHLWDQTLESAARGTFRDLWRTRGFYENVWEDLPAVLETTIINILQQMKLCCAPVFVILEVFKEVLPE